MDFLNDPTIKLLNKAMGAASVRHEAMSNNVANVNTRGYKADRVEFEEELQKALHTQSSKDVKLTTTHPKHFGVQADWESVEPKVVKDTATSMRLDGNNVDVDIEMSNIAANQLLYETLIDRVNGKLGSYRAVISGGTR